MRTLVALAVLASSAFAQEVPHRFVSVTTISPPVLQEIRYASTYNFTGTQLYPFPAAWIHEDAAAALRKVQEDLAAEGLGLKLFDAYRPVSVQQKMWDLIRDDRYVSDPAVNKGRHTRGVAVDVTLVDRTGAELPMPTGFDDFTERAHRMSPDWTPEQRSNSLRLEAVMKKHGFVPYPFEWWHYDLRDWKNYPPFDISFEDLAAGKTTAVPAL